MKLKKSATRFTSSGHRLEPIDVGKGHEHRFHGVRDESAYPLKLTVGADILIGREVPKRDIAFRRDPSLPICRFPVRWRKPESRGHSRDSPYAAAPGGD
jgi:hypothetical protein